MTDWYDNKALFEMQVALSKKMESLSAELDKTQVMIRDYNGLREKVNHVEECIKAMEGRSTGGKEMWGYIVGAAGVIFALISLTKN